MANELQISFDSGSNLYAIVRRTSDSYVWQTTTSTFVVWNDSNIANYDVAMTDNSGDYYSGDFPTGITTAANYLVGYFVRAGATPATTDEVLPSEVFFWSGGTTTGGTVGGNTLTIGGAVTILRTIARNAGISDTDDATYDLTNKHIILQLIGDDLARRTRCIQTVSSFTITLDSAAIDLSGIAGFHTERGLEYWIDGEDRPLSALSYQDINNRLARNTSTEKPRYIGFSATTAVGKIYPTSDAAYTGKVRWWAPLTGWTAGDTGVSATVLNIPADLMRGAINAGGIYFLQKNQPQNAKVVDQSRADYEAFVQRNMGSGSLGVQSLTTEPTPWCDRRW